MKSFSELNEAKVEIPKAVLSEAKLLAGAKMNEIGYELREMVEMDDESLRQAEDAPYWKALQKEVLKVVKKVGI